MKITEYTKYHEGRSNGGIEPYQKGKKFREWFDKEFNLKKEKTIL